MPNGKKRKATATLTPTRRVLPRKVGKPTRMAMMSGELPYPVRLGIPATPKIQLPVNGYVPPLFPLMVIMITNRPDLRYNLELRDETTGLSLFVHNLAAPGSKIFAAIFAGALLVAEHDFRLRVSVHPADGATPPHSDDVVYITTKTEFATPVTLPPIP